MSASQERLTCTSVARMAGISHDTAWRRLQKYRAGLISREALFAPPQLAGVGRKPTHVAAVIDAIVAATGITRAGAQERLRLVRLGGMPPDLLFASTQAIRAWRGAQKKEQYTPPNTGEWGNLGLGPRKRPQDIPGGTAWERTHLGR